MLIFLVEKEKNLKYYPESYHSAQRALHSKYPNWRFVANQLDLTFKEAVEAQYGVDDVKNTRKWVEFTYGDNEWRDMRAYDSTTGKWITLESRWTYASREAIEYYMDPRNSLNEDMIFANGALKAGYQVYYAADAKVLHSHDYGFKRQLRRNFDLGVSQADHPEVFEGISSESEGKRMVLSACKHFINIGKPLEIVHLAVQSGAKYIGYFLGKRYQKLPTSLVSRLTDNQTYWQKHRLKVEQERIDAHSGYGQSESEKAMRQRGE